MTNKIFNKPNYANMITLARIILIPIFVVLLLARFPYHEYYAALFFAILAISDMFDGYIARKYGSVTKIGAILDPLADKLLVCAALIFLIGRSVDAWMAYVIIARELIISALRNIVLLHDVNSKIVSARLSGKIKTITQLVAIIMAIMWLPYSWYFMLLATIVTVYSGIEYLWAERKLLREIV